jgi:cyanophycinase-like exopeptidase
MPGEGTILRETSRVVSQEPGLIVFFGSGETSASGRKVLDWLLRRTPAPVRMSVLETPAGFEPNSAQVAGRVAEFVAERLPNYHPQVTVVPARKRGTPYSPDDPQILAPLLRANAIFMGPGSPTYAVRQLRDSLAWHTLVARHRLGAALVLASAATVAASARALPVYEIYKVGEDLHWQAGLDLLAPYGLSVVFVPHWNNTDGGAELDTSRCYMGRARFARLREMLPSEVTVVGLDEHTALALDLSAQTARVLGKGSVVVQRGAGEQRFETGKSFRVEELGSFHPAQPEAGLPPEVWERVRDAHAQQGRPVAPPQEVRALVKRREAARTQQDWGSADRLRERIESLGWRIRDTRQGPQVERARERMA